MIISSILYERNRSRESTVWLSDLCEPIKESTEQGDICKTNVLQEKKKHKAVRAYVFPFFCRLHSSLCLCSCLAPTIVCAYSHHSLWQSHSNSAAAAHSTWSLERVNILQIRWSVCLCLGTRCWVCEVVNVADLTGWWATKSCSLSSTLLSLVSSPCLQLLAMLERQWGRQTDR